MTALLALAPCAVVLAAVLLFRLSALIAACLAFASAVALWAFGAFSPPAFAQFGRAAMDALVLELLVGVVIFFGLLFTEAITRAGSLQAIRTTIQTLELSLFRSVVLIVLGIGIAVESLTGYGVSMLVTIPLLLTIASRGRAMFLALIGMSLMTWGGPVDRGPAWRGARRRSGRRDVEGAGNDQRAGCGLAAIGLPRRHAGQSP